MLRTENNLFSPCVGGAGCAGLLVLGSGEADLVSRGCAGVAALIETVLGGGVGGGGYGIFERL